MGRLRARRIDSRQGGRGCGLAGLFLDLVDALDEEEDMQGDFRGGGAEVGELASDMSEAAAVALAEL